MSAIDRFRAQGPKIFGVLRILTGIMFACYGAQKLFGVFGGLPPGVPKGLIWTAGPIELIGGSLIALGLFTRSAAFVSSGLMAFAYFIGHAPNGFWPATNGGGPAIIYCWLFLYIAAQGPGAFALDNLRRGRVRAIDGTSATALRSEGTASSDISVST
jgi:putative oxidoreductase